MIFIKTKYYVWDIGNLAFTQALFFNIAHHLEEREWGSKYPIIMNELYKDGIAVENLEKALEEIINIKEEFKCFFPNQIIWEYNDLEKRPPWGNEIAEDISSLSNYFRSANGARDVLDLIKTAIKEGIRLKTKVYFENL